MSSHDVRIGWRQKDEKRKWKLETRTDFRVSTLQPWSAIPLADHVQYFPCALAQKVVRHHHAQGFRIERGALRPGANYLRSIEVCDEASQLQIAVFCDRVRGNGHLAPAAQSAQHGALGAHSLMRSQVVEPRRGVARALIVSADFNTQGTLPYGRAHLIEAEVAGYPLGETQAVHARGSQDQRLAITLFELAQSRVQISPDRNVFQIVTQGAQLRLSPQTAGGNPRTQRQFLQRLPLSGNENIAWIFALWNRTEYEPGRV
jgi:hypothetical protein